MKSLDARAARSDFSTDFMFELVNRHYSHTVGGKQRVTYTPPGFRIRFDNICFFASCDSLLPYPFPPNISMFDALREDFFQKSPKMGAEAPAVSNEQARIHSALVF